MFPFRNLLIRLLDLWSAGDTAQPLADHGILIETQLRELVLRDPWVEVHVYGAVALIEDGFAACSLECAFEHAESAVGLLFVALERVGVGSRIVMAVPTKSAHSRCLPMQS